MIHTLFNKLFIFSCGIFAFHLQAADSIAPEPTYYLNIAQECYPDASDACVYTTAFGLVTCEALYCMGQTPFFLCNAIADSVFASIGVVMQIDNTQNIASLSCCGCTASLRPSQDCLDIPERYSEEGGLLGTEACDRLLSTTSIGDFLNISVRRSRSSYELTSTIAR